jgi:filamentous hemagglutinin family protein
MGKTVTDRTAPAASRGVTRNVASVAARRRTREQLLASTAIRLALQASVLAGLTYAATVPASANPTGGTVVGGAATINQSNPNNTVITQTTDRAAINWQSFSIGTGQTTQFIQPSTSSTALNRVLGNDPSLIAGHLTANGNIVLINPNGVVFSAGSQVNVNSIVATPADMKDADFMAGKMNFSTPAPAGSSVTNAGTITVGELGIAALVGPKVANSGVINAKLGHVVLGGAETFTVDLYGDGLLSFDVGSKAHSPLSVVNSGQVNAEGGTVQISAETADALVTSVVNLGGQINAPTGAVAVDAGATGQLVVGGTVDVSGKAAGQTGGAVTLTGQDVAIESGALIDASGSAGGGSIKLGGGLHGADANVRNAATTSVAAGSTLDASAIAKGNGGTIAVWSEQQTNFAGTVKATGGAQGGDGGFAEVSSKGVLGFTGMVNLSAPLGRRGTLLLDPSELDIVDGTTNTDTITCAAGNCTANATPSLLTNTTLDGLLNGANANVNLAADTIDFKANVVGTGSLTANATTQITVDAGVSISNAAGGTLNVSLLGGNPEGAVGNIAFGANTSILTGGGGLTIIAANQLALDPTTVLRTAGGFTTLGASSLTLPNTIDTGDGGLQLAAVTGGIAQTGGSISAGFIEGSAAGNVALTQAANNIPFISGFATPGNFALTTTAPQLTITNTIGGGAGTIAVNVTNGNLQLGQDSIAATFSATGGTSLNVSGAIALQGNVTTNGPTTVVAGTGFDSEKLTFSTTNNPLSVTTPLLLVPEVGGLNSGTAATTINAPANAGMSVGDTNPVAGTLVVSNVDLADITSGALTLTTAIGQDITVNGATGGVNNGPITLQSGGKLSFPGDFTSPNNVNLVAASTITETGGAITAPVLSGSAGGAVALNNARNAIDGIAGFTVTGGGFSFLNGQTLVIVDPVAGGPAIAATGNIQVGTLTDTLILGEGPLRLVRPADLQSGTGIVLEAGSPANGSVVVDGPTTMNAPTTIGVDGPQFLVNNTLSTGANLLTVAAVQPISVGQAAAGTLNISDAALGNITAGSLLVTTNGTINVDSVTAHPAIGLVNLSSNAGITFAPVPDLAGGSTVFANGLSAITSAGDIVLAENVSTGPSLFLGAPTSNIVQQTGGITTSAFSAIAGGNIEIFQTTNSINTINALSSTGGFIDLQTNAPGHLLTIAGPVTNTAANGEVFLQAGGDMTVDGQVSSTANHVILNAGGALTLTGNAAVSAPTSFVGLTSAGSMQINGSLQASTGNVDLFSQAGITEGATGSIVTPLLTAEATAGSLLLNSPANQVGVLGGVFVSGGNFSFVNGTNLIVADIPGDGAPQNAINAGTGSINVQVQGGSLTLGRPTQPAGSIEPVTATLLGTGGVTLGASGDINVVGPTTANATTGMTAGGNIGIAANLGITGDLQLVATTGQINQTGGTLAISGTLTGSSATDTTLATVGDVAPDSIPTLGNFTAGGTLTLVDGVSLNLVGNVGAGTEVALNSSGDIAGITQSAGIITAPTLSLLTNGDIVQNNGGLNVGTLLVQAGGGVTLTGTANSIGTIAAATANGGIAIRADAVGQLLTVTGPVVAGSGEVFLESGGAMTVNGQVSSLAAGETVGGVQLTTQGGALTITGNAGVNSVDRGVGLQSSGPMQIDGAVEAPRGAISLSGAGATEGATGSLVATTLSTVEVGNVSLTSTDNQVGTLTNIHVRQGNFTFVNAGDLTIVDTVQQGTLVSAIDADTGKVNVQANGTLSLGAPIQDVDIPPPTSATLIGTGGITLAATDGNVNVIGPTTANGALSLAGSNIGLGNSLAVTGNLQLAATGAITQTGGLLTVTGALSGSSGDDTTLTTFGNTVTTLGSFASGGVLTFANTGPLTIAGNITSVGDMSFSSLGTMTVNGGSFTARDGNITFAVTPQNGAQKFVQTGTTTLDPQTITINVNQGFQSASTILPTPLISLDTFLAPQANLVLQLGNGKATASNLQVGGLDVIGAGGSAALFGSVNGIAGPGAARLAFQSNTPPDPLYQLNNCTIQLGCTPPNSIFNPRDPVIDILAALQASVAHDGVVYLSTGRQKKPYTDPTIDTLNIGSEDLF